MNHWVHQQLTSIRAIDVGSCLADKCSISRCLYDARERNYFVTVHNYVCQRTANSAAAVDWAFVIATQLYFSLSWRAIFASIVQKECSLSNRLWKRPLVLGNSTSHRQNKRFLRQACSVGYECQLQTPGRYFNCHQMPSCVSWVNWWLQTKAFARVACESAVGNQ